MSEAVPQQLTIRQVLQLKPVRRLWLAQIVSVFGDFLAIFAVLSYVSFGLHATATQVNLISVSFIVPFAFVSPLAGVFVDRWNVKRTMIASDLIRAVLALALVFAGSMGQFYAILFLIGVVSTFFVPAQTVTLRTIVPREGLLAANSLLQQAFQVVRIVSPALAGLMVNAFGPSPCYYLDSVSYVFSATMIATLAITRVPATRAPGSHPIKSILTDLMAGTKFILTHSTITFVILAMAAGFFAISCFGPLIAVYVRDDLHATSLVFGIVSALIGVGMIAGTLVMNSFAQKFSKTHLALGGLLTMGAFVLVLAAVKTLAGAAISMFGVGFGVIFVIVSAQTLMQGQTPMELIGRVSSTVMSIIFMAQLIGLVFSGSLAQRLGLTKLFYASAAMLLLITVFGYFRLPQQTAIHPAGPQEQTAD